MSYPKTFIKAGNPDLVVSSLADEKAALGNGYIALQGDVFISQFPTDLLNPHDARYPLQGMQGAHGPAGVESHRTDPIDPRTGSRTLHPLAPAPDQRIPYTGDPVAMDQFGNPLRADPTYTGDLAYSGYRGVGDPGYPGNFTGDPLNPEYPLRVKEPFVGFGKKFTKLNLPDRTAHNAAEEAAAIADGYVYQGGAF